MRQKFKHMKEEKHLFCAIISLCFNIAISPTKFPAPYALIKGSVHLIVVSA